MRQCLILHGSPHAAGHTGQLVDRVCAKLPLTRKTIMVYDKAIAPCIDCGRCTGGHPCPIPDDMPEIMADIDRSDILLLASPLHFTSLSAPLVATLSRFQQEWQAQRAGTSLLARKPRQAGLLLTAGSEYRSMAVPSRSVALAAINSLGMRFSGMVLASNTDKIPISNNAVIQKQIDELTADIQQTS